MVLEGEDLELFGMDRLRGKKRNQVRKGLRNCDIRRVNDIEPHLEEIREIYISQARRHTEHYELPDTPPRYYVEHAEAWRTRERRYLTTCGRELWGAFVHGELRAFLVSSQVEDVRFIEKMKTHTEALKLCPSDALYYTVLEYGAHVDGCQRVINPGIRGGGLDRYKEQFLFRRTQIPVFVSNVRLFRLAKRVLRLREHTRTVALSSSGMPSASAQPS